MKNLSIIFLLTIFVAMSCQNKKAAEQTLYENNLKKYLKNTLNLNPDSLSSRLVLINYFGCKPCINKHLHFLAAFDSNTKNKFSFVVPASLLSEFQQHFPDYEGLKLYIDSNNAMFKQNIPIEGLSVFVFKDGILTETKKVSIYTKSDEELKIFWFD